MTDISGGYLRTFGTIPGPSDQTDPNNQLGAPTKTMEYKLVNGGTRTNAVVGEIPAGEELEDVVYTATFGSFTKATKVLTLSTTPTGTLVNGMTVTGGTPAIIGDVKISNVNTQTNLTLDKEINAPDGGTISFTTFDRVTGRQRWTGSNTFQNSVNFEAGATGLTLDNPWEGPEILDGASYVYTEDATTNVLISGSNGIPPTGGAGWSTSIKLYVDGELGMSTQLSPTFGGTGVSSYTAGDILYATGASTLTKLAIGSANQVLSVNSGATAPEWTSISDFTNDWETATVNSAFSLYPKDNVSNDQPNIIFPLDPGSLSNPGPYKFYIEGGSTTVHFDGTLTIGNPLAIGSGGTGLSSYTAGDLIYYKGGTKFSKIAIGTALQVLAVNGAGNTPEWTSLSYSQLTGTPTIPDLTTASNFGTASSSNIIVGSKTKHLELQGVTIDIEDKDGTSMIEITDSDTKFKGTDISIIGRDTTISPKIYFTNFTNPLTSWIRLVGQADAGASGTHTLTLPQATGTLALLSDIPIGGIFTISGSFTSKVATATQCNEYIFSSGVNANGSCRIVLQSDTNNPSGGPDDRNVEILFKKEKDLVQGSIGMGRPGTETDDNDMIIDCKTSTNSILLQTQGTTRLEVGPSEIVASQGILINKSGEALTIKSTESSSAAETNIAFRDSNGSRIGFVGDGSPSNNNMYLYSDWGDLRIITNTAGKSIKLKTGGDITRMSVNDTDITAYKKIIASGGIETTSINLNNPAHVDIYTPEIEVSTLTDDNTFIEMRSGTGNSSSTKVSTIKLYNKNNTKSAFIGLGTDDKLHLTNNAFSGNNLKVGSSGIDVERLGISSGGTSYPISWKSNIITSYYGYLYNVASGNGWHTNGVGDQFLCKTNRDIIYYNTDLMGNGSLITGYMKTPLGDIYCEDIFCDELNYQTCNTCSDARLKKNLKPIENAIQTLNKLTPLLYDKKVKDETDIWGNEYIPDSGFIAQDVYNQVPELRFIVNNVAEDIPENFDSSGNLIRDCIGWDIVEDKPATSVPVDSLDASGNPNPAAGDELTEATYKKVLNPDKKLSINYEELTAYLVKGIQEQDVRIKNLENIITKLTSSSSFSLFKKNLT